MIYNDYLKVLSNKFLERLKDISADHNFDYGDEFEIAICEILRNFLPTKYGICRGFIVNRNGKKVGDDIIIYDQEKFPTLKLNKRDDYSRKENIPVEAVYAYIEAKHKLTSESLKKALNQISDVKKICNERKKIGYNPESKNKAYPNFKNPIFTLIISRYIEDQKNNQEIENTYDFLMSELIEINKKKTPFLPEMIVAGNNLAALVGYYEEKENKVIPTNFLIEKNNYLLKAMIVNDLAFGFGLANLFTAIDLIELGKMPWIEMLNEVIELTDTK